MTTAADQTPEAVAFDRRIHRPLKGPHWTSEKELPADTGWAEYDEARAAHFALVADYRKTSAAQAKNEREQAAAERDYPEQAAVALRAGDKAPADPLPKLKQQAEQLARQAEVQARAIVQSADEIRDLVHANRDEWHAFNLATTDEAVAQAQADLDVLVASCDRVYRLRVQDNWLRGMKASAQTLGSAELNKLAELLDEAARPRQLLYVDARNFKRLKQGDDAEALDGTKVPAGTPLSAVVIAHTPYGAWGPTPERHAVRPTEGGVG